MKLLSTAIDLLSAAGYRHIGMDHFALPEGELVRAPKLEADGLVWICASRIVASSRGRYLLRVIAACFDRYFAEG